MHETAIQQKALDNARNQLYKSQSRVYKRFKAIASMPNAYFITLTYDNEHLHLGCNENAKEWSKMYLTNYYGNDDYGKTNGRYHHHVFGNFKEKINLSKSWSYGAVNVQKMHGSPKQMAKYIQKLQRHSIKSRTEKIFKSKEIYINKTVYPEQAKEIALNDLIEQMKINNKKAKKLQFKNLSLNELTRLYLLEKKETKKNEQNN